MRAPFSFDGTIFGNYAVMSKLVAKGVRMFLVNMFQRCTALGASQG